MKTAVQVESSVRRRLRAAAQLLIALSLAAGGLAAAAPADAETLLREAREAARADRHAEAIAAFERALQAAPQRRPEWLLEWADQLTWAGRLDEAIALYREATGLLAPPERVRAHVGLARALSWAERHAEAVAEYERALAIDPHDAQAQIGRARVQSWRGRHRDAVAQLQPVLQARPHEREATLVLAESLAWMGRPERALAVLRAQLAADPGDERAARLLAELERDTRAQTSLDWRDFEQSDGLRIRQTQLATRLPLADGRGQVGLLLERTVYRPAAGPVEHIEVRRPGVEARYRLSDALEWSGSLFLDLIDTRGAAGDHRRWTHSTYLTWRPVDGLRLDLSSQRWTFDSEAALRAGLTASQRQVSIDATPDDRRRFSLRANHREYSDGNSRRGWRFDAEQRLWRPAQLWLGYRHTRFDYSLPGQPGYYNPARYRADELLLHAAGTLGPGLGWGLRWAVGREVEQPGGARPIRSGGVQLNWTVQPRLVLEAAYDHSTSRTLATGGFERGIVRLSLRYRH